MALYYCKRCGRVVNRHNYPVNNKCDYCNAIVYPVPEKYWIDGLDFAITNEQKRVLREELVKTSPEFDQALFESRDEDLARRDAEMAETFARIEAIQKGRDKGNPYGVECPYCHATNVKKITMTSKVLHTALFGVLSMGRNSKEFHCNHCNSDF